MRSDKFWDTHELKDHPSTHMMHTDTLAPRPVWRCYVDEMLHVSRHCLRMQRCPNHPFISNHATMKEETWKFHTDHGIFQKTNHTCSPTKKQCQASPRALFKSWFYLVTGCAILPDWNLIPGHRSNQPVGFFIKANGERSNLFGMARFTVIHNPAKTKMTKDRWISYWKNGDFPHCHVSLLESFPETFSVVRSPFPNRRSHWIIWDPRCSAVDWRWAPLENPGRNGKIWDDLWILDEFDHIKNDDNDTGNINNNKNNNGNHVEIFVKWMKFGTYFTNLEICGKCHVFLLLLFQ